MPTAVAMGRMPRLVGLTPSRPLAIAVDPVFVVVRAADLLHDLSSQTGRFIAIYDAACTVRLIALVGLGAGDEDGDGWSIRAPESHGTHRLNW